MAVSGIEGYEYVKEHILPKRREFDVLWDDSVYNFPEEHRWASQQALSVGYAVSLASEQYGITPDIRFGRGVLLNMLLEAHDKEQFFQETDPEFGIPTEDDRQHIIMLLEHTLTDLGLMKPHKVLALRNFWNYMDPVDQFPTEIINAAEAILDIPDIFNRRKDLDTEQLLTFIYLVESLKGVVQIQKIINSPESIIPGDYSLESVSRATREIKEKYPNMKIGYWSGTWNPLHYIHLMQAKDWAQLCDLLIIGVDCDELVLNTKSHLWIPQRNLVPFEERVDMWKKTIFPSYIVKLDFTQPNDENYLEIFSAIRPDIVFLDSTSSYYGKRAEQVISIGAIPYGQTTIPFKFFSSTDWWRAYASR